MSLVVLLVSARGNQTTPRTNHADRDSGIRLHGWINEAVQILHLWPCNTPFEHDNEYNLDTVLGSYSFRTIRFWSWHCVELSVRYSVHVCLRLERESQTCIWLSILAERMGSRPRTASLLVTTPMQLGSPGEFGVVINLYVCLIFCWSSTYST